MSYLLNYIKDNEFRMNYTKSHLNVINYNKINYMEDTKISLSYDGGGIVVKGQDLRIRKLLDYEILIVGNIENIEFKE